MKRFKVTVTKTDEYEVEIDENIINDEFMAEFKKNFFDIDTLQVHAENIAQLKSRFDPEFFEGYGPIMIDGKAPHHYPKAELNGININVLSEDEYIETDAIEVVTS